MDKEFAQFERLEASLGELAAADRAGVFARTSLDTAAMFARPVAARRILLYRVGSIAAVLLVAVTVWSVMFVGQVRRVQNQSLMVTVRGTDGRPFYAELTGPAMAIASNRSPNDFDGDGDLDLADLRTFQLQFSVNR